MGQIHWIPINPNQPVRIEDASEEPPLKQMQKYVGGYIEHVNVLYMGKHQHMYVNEDGAVRSPPLPTNKRATEIYRNAAVVLRGSKPQELPCIHGPAILCVDLPFE